MTTIQIACDNCGAKYKLPETFKSPKAKCQKCGSMIDVASQRDAAGGTEASSAAKPASKPAAAARPAVDRSKSKAGGRAGAGKAAAKSGAGAKAGGRASSRRRKGGDDEDGGEGEGRRSRSAPQKDNKPLIFGGIGLLALVIVVVVFMMNGGDDEGTASNEASTNSSTEDAGKATADSTDDPVANAPGDATEPDATKPDASKPDGGDTKPAEAPEPEEGSTPAKPAEASAPAKLPPNAPTWMKYRTRIKTIADVNLEFPEVPWDQLTAEKKATLQEMAQNYAAGGRPGLDAEKYFRDNPYEAMFALIDHLRSLDHKDSFDMLNQAYPINRFMTELTNGLQTGFAPPADISADMEPAQIHWNAITTRTWLKFFKSHPDEATFEAQNKERRKKQVK